MRDALIAGARALVPCALSFCGGHAAAQDEPAATSGGLEEVMVSARRVEESLQRAPVSVSAFTAAALEERAIGNVTDVVAFAPNVNFGTGYSGSEDGFYYIRGIGLNDFTAALDPPVGLYVDGVYLGRAAGAAFDLVDLQRIEVLRGPQGTLFGRNTSGGAIQLISSRPSGRFGGWAAVTGGQRDRWDVRGVLDFPLGDTVAGRLSVLRRQQDGWVERESDGRTLGDVDTLAGRLTLDWSPTEALGVRFTADYTRSENTPVPQVSGDADPTRSSPCPPFCIPLPADIDQYSGTGFRRSWASQPLVNDTDARGAALTLEWDLRALALKSITAFRKLDQLSWADYDATPYVFYDDEIPLSQEQVSQELQLSGESGGGRVRWVGGLFYFDEEVDQTNAITLGATGPLGVLACPVCVPPAPGAPPIFPVVPLVVDPPAPFDGRYRIVARQRILPETRSHAVFGQATFRFTERWSGTLGVRWSRDEKDQGYNFAEDNTIPNHPLFPVGTFPSLQTSASNRWSSVDPRVGLELQATEDLTVYASYAEGFRAGGFNSRPVVLPVDTFDPEEVGTYELGFKSEWLDRRVRVNGAVFSSAYDRMQIAVLAGGFFSIANAGDATIRGAELEIAARPLEALELSFALGYLDAEYDSVTADAVAAGVLVTNALPMTPEWTFNAGAQHRWTLDGRGTLTARVDYSFVDERYSYANNAPGNLLDAHSLVNVRLAWRSADERWSVALTGKNVLDERYLNWAEDVRATASPLGVLDLYPAPPREWSAEVRYRF